MAVIGLGSNISALLAKRKLDEASTTLSRTFERLSSGMRINRAGDDAAGLAVSSGLNLDARVYGQAIRNVNDGISALNIAQGGAQQLTDVLVRLRELATQSANGTFSRTQRISMDTEANALTNEFNRIVSSLSFNGRKLLDGSMSNLSLQLGYGSNGSLSVGLGQGLQHGVGDGTFQTAISLAEGDTPLAITIADVNRDGKQDLISVDTNALKLNIRLGNGDGTFSSVVSYSITGSYANSIVLGDFNADGKIDVATGDGNSGYGALNVLLGNGDGSFGVSKSFATGLSRPSDVQTGDFNGDGKLDLVAVDANGNAVSVLLGNGDGSFRSYVSYTVGNDILGQGGLKVADLNNDGKLDLVTADYNDNTLSILLGVGDGTFLARRTVAVGTAPMQVAVGDLNHDGILDIIATNNISSTTQGVSILIGNGDGSFQAQKSFGTGTNPYNVLINDFNGDGNLDFITADYTDHTISLFLGNGDGSFQARRTSLVGTGGPQGIAVGDLNGDGALDIAATGGRFDIAVLLANASNTSTIGRLNLTTRDEALGSISTIDAILLRLQKELGNIGSSQSRLGFALGSLTALRENSLAAYGRIMDADVATEAAALVRSQTLQQIGAAVLAQANLQPQIVLQLLRNI